MRQFGLIGYPLGHSFSTTFFTQKFRKEHIEARYENFETPSVEKIRDFVAESPLLEGFNVTIPHKQNIIPHLDFLSPEATAIGAVNVVQIKRKEKKEHDKNFSSTRLSDIQLIGHNTDVIGFIKSLRPLLHSHHLHALILGTGGASRAVIYGLQKLGISATCVSRTLPLSPISIGGEEIPILTYQQLKNSYFMKFFLVINCTPLGMTPHQALFPSIPYDALTPKHLLYDLVYNPPITQFLKQGKIRGSRIKNGLEMLELQALAAWDIWNNS